MEQWDIYDASDQELTEELAHLIQVAPQAPGYDAPRVAKMRFLIEQELEERQVSFDIFTALRCYGTAGRSPSRPQSAKSPPSKPQTPRNSGWDPNHPRNPQSHVARAPAAPQIVVEASASSPRNRQSADDRTERSLQAPALHQADRGLVLGVPQKPPGAPEEFDTEVEDGLPSGRSESSTSSLLCREGKTKQQEEKGEEPMSVLEAAKMAFMKEKMGAHRARKALEKPKKKKKAKVEVSAPDPAPFRAGGAVVARPLGAQTAAQGSTDGGGTGARRPRPVSCTTRGPPPVAPAGGGAGRARGASPEKAQLAEQRPGGHGSQLTSTSTASVQPAGAARSRSVEPGPAAGASVASPRELAAGAASSPRDPGANESLQDHGDRTRVAQGEAEGPADGQPQGEATGGADEDAEGRLQLAQGAEQAGEGHAAARGADVSGQEDGEGRTPVSMACAEAPAGSEGSAAAASSGVDLGECGGDPERGGAPDSGSWAAGEPASASEGDLAGAWREHASDALARSGPSGVPTPEPDSDSDDSLCSQPREGSSKPGVAAGLPVPAVSAGSPVGGGSASDDVRASLLISDDESDQEQSPEDQEVLRQSGFCSALYVAASQERGDVSEARGGEPDAHSAGPQGTREDGEATAAGKMPRRQATPDSEGGEREEEEEGEQAEAVRGARAAREPLPIGRYGRDLSCAVRPDSSQDCTGIGLGAFHYGDHDGVGAWEATPDPSPLCTPIAKHRPLVPLAEIPTDGGGGRERGGGRGLDADPRRAKGKEREERIREWKEIEAAMSSESAEPPGDRVGEGPKSEGPESAREEPKGAGPESARGPSAEVRPLGGRPLSGASRLSGMPSRGSDSHRSGTAEVRNYSDRYPYFEEIFTAFSHAQERSAGQTVKRPEPGHVAEVMRSTVNMLETWKEQQKKAAVEGEEGPLRGEEEPLPELDEADEWEQRFRRLFRVSSVESHPEVYANVTRALLDSGRWEEADEAGAAIGWNLIWTWSAKVRVPPQELLVWQVMNHYPTIKELTRKDLLKRHLMRAASMHATGRHALIFDLMPTTFTLPKDYVAFVDAFSKAADGDEEKKGGGDCGGNVWIMKPIGLSRGRGIYLVDDIAAVDYAEPMIVQRYLCNPLLVDGFKFDLRLYVVVTSISPLEAFLCQEGFARFATQRYTLDKAEIGNKFIHLTNSSIQKEQEDMDPNDLPAPLRSESEINGCARGCPAFLEGGSKCSLARLWWWLQQEGGIDTEALWSRISDVVLRSLFVVEEPISHQVNSFELLGFDVMIDTELKPWLVEVNSSPSLATDTELDVEVKGSMLRDTVRLVDPPDFDRDALYRVLMRRLGGGANQRGARPGGGMGMGTLAEERDQINRDLNAILRGRMPRSYGEMPAYLGQFVRIAPSKGYDALLKTKKSSTKTAMR
ncbi:hypothetical protein CYMTET_46683 [Cymbomonas tetramitiformis]|uniref:Tubulin-tyrosine ligase family protein n=1 Tax=Cymbomonas tetramitiformis TaxID=36881 RepID=A0AAE0BWW6_9CHLO|nr:hypothetical protein CYMTET_46683 [Cymbomonas tetramitiformis]